MMNAPRGMPGTANARNTAAKAIVAMLLACVIGAIIYRIAIALALNTSWLGLQASDLNLVTAVLVGIALMLPNVRNPLKSLFRRSA